MASSPQYAATPLLGKCYVDLANTNLDGSGDITTLLVSGENGCVVDAIRIKALETTTIGMIRLFHKEFNDTEWTLLKEFPVVAITPSGIVASFEYLFVFDEHPFTIPSGDALGVSTHKAESFVVYAFGGNL